MHKIQNTPKIVTIIGLALEGFAAISAILSAILIPLLFKSELFLSNLGEMTSEEIEIFDIMIGWMTSIMIVFAVLFTVMFTINIILFTKLIRGKFTEKQAKKVYLYQAIWGGISILLNTITGILYLVSGVQGYNGHVDRIETREGI